MKRIWPVLVLNAAIGGRAVAHPPIRESPSPLPTIDSAEDDLRRGIPGKVGVTHHYSGRFKGLVARSRNACEEAALQFLDWTEERERQTYLYHQGHAAAVDLAASLGTDVITLPAAAEEAEREADRAEKYREAARRILRDWQCQAQVASDDVSVEPSGEVIVRLRAADHPGRLF